ncbi:LSU ribosomal protein L23p (L23Ae) [hydrothermal vent metagenome]|uniref:LSU ribosomal protein L23p (L23Ae) n=1 Tax=hydrothermal vent metagenome TaxID=652676 RepID=A0A3B1E5B7_9ZZZZ
MDATYIIKKPMLTEKSTEAMNEQGRFTFLVDRRASKDQIKDAVESIYGVKVVGVNTQVRKGKERRLKYGWVTETKTKKAIVRLAEGQTIDLF